MVRYKRYIRTKDGEIVDTNWYVGGWYVGKDLKQSDNILDLIEIGDVVRYKTKNQRLVLYEITNLSALKAILFEPEIFVITQIYAKQGNNYILVWDKERGVI